MKKLPDFLDALARENKITKTVDSTSSFGFKIGNKILGGTDPVFIAGPCSVENREMLLTSAEQVKLAGCDGLRAGAFKPCTYPVLTEHKGWREGTREYGLDLFKELKEIMPIDIISEIMSPNQLDISHDAIDIIQVGTRNFQNYTLLDELAKQNKPVILKRGTWATMEEILGALERLICHGKTNVAICLRGVIGAPPYRHIYKSTRWQPDLMMILALKDVTNIPVIYDPSHATGNRSFVPGISKAAISCGADGLMIEAHPDPVNSISDADQAISFSLLKGIIKDCKNIHSVIN
jgi:3-deoxy-7-phosphoheptulonate synthase